VHLGPQARRIGDQRRQSEPRTCPSRNRAAARTHLQAAMALDPYDTEALAMVALLRED